MRDGGGAGIVTAEGCCVFAADFCQGGFFHSCTFAKFVKQESQVYLEHFNEEGFKEVARPKLISVHYAGLRNPVTALEVLNIGDVIRRGELMEEGTANHPTSRRYELKAQDGATLKVIIDFDRKKDKNKSVINFYSDRTSDTGAHNVSSGIITDSFNNIPQLSENANETDENGLERTGRTGRTGRTDCVFPFQSIPLRKCAIMLISLNHLPERLLTEIRRTMPLI